MSDRRSFKKRKSRATKLRQNLKTKRKAHPKTYKNTYKGCKHTITTFNSYSTYCESTKVLKTSKAKSWRKKRIEVEDEIPICKNWYYSGRCSYGNKVYHFSFLFLLYLVQIRSCYKSIQLTEEKRTQELQIQNQTMLSLP